MSNTKNTLVKYNNYQSLFDDWTHRIFNDVFSDPFFASTRNWALEDIKDNDKEYVLEVELPRFKREEIEVTTSENTLSIKAKNDKGRVYNRLFTVNNAIADKATVTLKNGVLSVSIPKVELEKPKVNRLEIKEIN